MVILLGISAVHCRRAISRCCYYLLLLLLLLLKAGCITTSHCAVFAVHNNSNAITSSRAAAAAPCTQLVCVAGVRARHQHAILCPDLHTL
jgi:hypothetical protein